MNKKTHSFLPFRANSHALILGLIVSQAMIWHSHCSAALLAFEDFNPTSGTASIVGVSSGTGFAGAWLSGPGGGTINRMGDNNNMHAYPANVIFPQPAGGKVQNASGYTDKSVERLMGTPINLDANGKVYLSYLWNDYSGANRDNAAGVYFGNATNRYHVLMNYAVPGYDPLTISQTNATGEPWNGGTGAIQNHSASTFGGVTGATLYFVAAELQTVAAGNDVIRAKAYLFSPGGGYIDSDPNSIVWDVVSSFAGTGTLTNLGLYMEGAGFPELDAIRVGTTWLDVTSVPEPGRSMLLLLSGLGLVSRRSRVIKRNS